MRLRGVFAGDELGNAIGDELPAAEKSAPDIRQIKYQDPPANKGVLFGVLIPKALLAGMPRIGVASRAGVPAAEGVLAKNRGCGGGASGIDCSPKVLVLSCISTSSEVGKSIGGDDMVEGEQA